ncbi:hypothetical protein [Woodsholea maritima]|uniref:hypothetical protein n=1 Tax=Woodsholea maritima TaxID=240237 RepID=UPI000380F74C|nr:hypothetical protein [Woodsholea maritima]
MNKLSECHADDAPRHHIIKINQGKAIAFKIGGIRTPEAGQIAFADLMAFYRDNPARKLLFDMRDARYPYTIEDLIRRGHACARALPATKVAFLVSEDSEKVGVISLTAHVMSGHKAALFTNLQEALAYLIWD